MAISVPRSDRVIAGRTYRVTRGGTFMLQDGLGGWVDERSIPHDKRPWRPFEQATPHSPAGRSRYEFDEGETFWANGHYLVFRREVHSDGKLAMVHLSMRTVENDARHDWREMQRVKTELVGEDWEGVELYPAEDRVVDLANQFHLFCFPFHLPFGFSEGMRASTEQAAKNGATQRPGSTTGGSAE